MQCMGSAIRIECLAQELFAALADRDARHRELIQNAMGKALA
jgi:hypothetical protein